MFDTQISNIQTKKSQVSQTKTLFETTLWSVLQIMVYYLKTNLKKPVSFIESSFLFTGLSDQIHKSVFFIDRVVV